MRKLMLFCTLLIALFFLYTCKKDKTPECPPCSQNPESCHSVLEAKEYFAFKVGTWWVYEEETSKERDSLYVYEGIDDLNSYNFSTRIYSSYEDYNYHYWPEYFDPSGCDKVKPVASKCLYIKRSKFKIGDYIGEIRCMFINYNVNDFIYSSDGVFCGDNKVKVKNLFEEYLLPNMSIPKVLEITTECNFLEGVQPTSHFFSKNIGLIRKELLDSKQIWNLVSYHIEK